MDQLKDERKFYEEEMRMERKYEADRQKILEQNTKGNKKQIGKAKQKLIEEELRKLDQDYRTKQNNRNAVQKQTNLKINDFSVKDKKLAEKILQEKKIKAEMKRNME